MKEAYEKLYKEMLAEINDWQNQALPEKQIAEECFHIARDYGQHLKHLMKNIDFEDDNEEIDFFRNVKPQFVCYIEYFASICSALFFEPANPGDSIAFWQHEKERLRNFNLQFETFINYYKSGQHHSDSIYFLRQNNELKFLRNIFIYDADIDWCTSHDRLVRNFIAFNMYSEYCDKKLLKQEGLNNRPALNSGLNNKDG